MHAIVFEMISFFEKHAVEYVLKILHGVSRYVI